MISGVQTIPTSNGPLFIPRVFAWLTAITLMAWFVSPAVLPFCLLLAVYALRGPRQALEALAIVAFLLLMSRGSLSIARWVVVFAAFGRVLWDTAVGDAGSPKILAPLLVFTIYVLTFSFFTSPYPDVSIFKIVSFSVGTVSIVVLFHRTRDQKDYWLGFFFTFFAFLLIVSIPLYGLGAGYGRNGTGFQSILSHPQTYGPVLAPATAMLASYLLFRGNRSWLLILGTLLALYGMYASQARTSIFSTALAFVVAVVLIAPQAGGIKKLFTLRRVELSTYIAIAAVGVFIFWRWGDFQERIADFVVKDDGIEEVSIGKSFVESRGELVEVSMRNFQQSPLLGIGFGVPSDTWEWESGRLQRGFMGLPTSASVEKGFLPTAVLEEVGLTGAFLVLVLLFALFWPMVKAGEPMLLWMALSAFFTNFGEATFFSIGGIGFYYWLILGFCYARASVILAEREQLSASIAPAHENAFQRRVSAHGRRSHIHPKHPSLAANRSSR